MALNSGGPSLCTLAATTDPVHTDSKPWYAPEHAGATQTQLNSSRKLRTQKVVLCLSHILSMPFLASAHVPHPPAPLCLPLVNRQLTIRNKPNWQPAVPKEHEKQSQAKHGAVHPLSTTKHIINRSAPHSQHTPHTRLQSIRYTSSVSSSGAITFDFTAARMALAPQNCPFHPPRAKRCHYGVCTCSL